MKYFFALILFFSFNSVFASTHSNCKIEIKAEDPNVVGSGYESNLTFDALGEMTLQNDFAVVRKEAEVRALFITRASGFELKVTEKATGVTKYIAYQKGNATEENKAKALKKFRKQLSSIKFPCSSTPAARTDVNNSTRDNLKDVDGPKSSSKKSSSGSMSTKQ